MTVERVPIAAEGPGRPAIGLFELRPADVVILAALALFSLVAVAGRATVSRWPPLVAANLGVAAAVLASAAFLARLRRPLPGFLLRTVTVTLSYAYLFAAVAPLQLVLHGRSGTTSSSRSRSGSSVSSPPSGWNGSSRPP